jgi:hypothetical protein
LPLPAGLVGGRYGLEVGLSGQPGQVVRQVVGQVALRSTPPSAPSPARADGTAVRFANGLTLLSWRADREGPADPPTLTRGGKLRVWLTWEVSDEVPHDAASSVFLADQRGEKYGLSDSYPPHDLQFTAAWLKGSRHEQRFELPVDERLPPGLYRLSVELYDYASGARVPLRDQATTRLPLQLYKAAGRPAEGGGVRFRDGVVLERQAVRLTADALEVDLRWAATARPVGEYTVFLHLYDRAGTLVAQQDGPPLGGAYPTQTWDAGEAIEETRRIPLPPGGLPDGAGLKVGLYLPGSGERLPTVEGRGGVELPLAGR